MDKHKKQSLWIATSALGSLASAIYVTAVVPGIEQLRDKQDLEFGVLTEFFLSFYAIAFVVPVLISFIGLVGALRGGKLFIVSRIANIFGLLFAVLWLVGFYAPIYMTVEQSSGRMIRNIP